MVPRTCLGVATVLCIVILLGCDSHPVSPQSYEYSSSETRSFAPGDSASVVVDTFVGAITFSEAAVDSIRVTATKWAVQEEDLDRLPVGMTQVENEVQVTASNPDGLDEVAVDFEITAPADTRLDLGTGVGTVDCEGRPRPGWSVAVGVGDIELAIPDDASISVELLTGVGEISVDFPVEGEVSGQRVVGIIGAGDDGEIVALAGVGDILIVHR